MTRARKREIREWTCYWIAVQWITNSVHSTNEHHFPHAKWWKEEKKRIANQEMDQSFPSKSSYVESMQEYTMTQVCIVFRSIFNDFFFSRPSSSYRMASERNWYTLLHNEGDSRSNLNFRFEHCRLNYSLLAIGMCLVLWISMLDAQLFQCMLCTNTPVFGNSTKTNQQQIINSHSVDPTEFPIVLRSLCAHSIRIFLYFCVLDKSTAVLWDCVRRWRRGRQRERERKSKSLSAISRYICMLKE